MGSNLGVAAWVCERANYLALRGRQRSRPRVAALGCPKGRQGHGSRVAGIRLLDARRGASGGLLNDLPRKLIGVARAFGLTCSGRHGRVSHALGQPARIEESKLDHYPKLDWAALRQGCELLYGTATITAKIQLSNHDDPETWKP